MQAVAERAHLGTVASERGADIQRRLDALGISDREFHAKTGVDRKTLRRAVEGLEHVRPSTFLAIESALDQLEARIIGTPAVAASEPHVVTFRLSDNHGVDVVVSGPVDDVDKLRETVEKLIRGMGDK